MRRTANPVGRPRNKGEILSEERAIKFAPSMMDALQNYSRETGITVAETIRRAVAAMLGAREQPQSKSEVVVSLGEDEKEELEKLSVALRFRDPARLLQELALRSLEIGASGTVTYLHGDYIRHDSSRTTFSPATKEENNQVIKAPLTYDEFEQRGEVAGEKAAEKHDEQKIKKEAA